MNPESLPADPALPEGYRLGDLVVDLRTRRVLRAGVDLGVTRLSFDLLLALVRAAPGVVSYDELMVRVWPGLVVSPETLTQRVKLLRQALGESAENPRYLLAVRGIGYRLQVSPEPWAIADGISTAKMQAAGRAQRKSWRRFGTAAVVLVALAGTASWISWHEGRRAPVPAAHEAEAYRKFQRAEAIVNGTPESFQAAVSLYSEALDRNPAFAAALSGRAMNRAALAWVGSPIGDGLDGAIQDAEQALDLDPHEARAHLVLASVHAMRGEWLASAAGFDAALAISPDNAEVLLRQSAGLLLPTGQLLKAAAAGKRALALQPNSGFANSMLAFVQQARAEDADAQRLAEKAMKLGGDPHAMYSVLASVAARQGHAAEAADFAARALPAAVRQAGGDEALQAGYAALADHAKRPAALAALRLLVGNPVWEEADPRSRQAVLYLFAAFGAFDDLYGELQRLTQATASGTPQIIAVASLWAPEMRAFRRDQRFQKLVQQLHLVEYWRHAGAPDGCHLAGSTLLCE